MSCPNLPLLQDAIKHLSCEIDEETLMDVVSRSSKAWVNKVMVLEGRKVCGFKITNARVKATIWKWTKQLVYRVSIFVDICFNVWRGEQKLVRSQHQRRVDTMHV